MPYTSNRAALQARIAQAAAAGLSEAGLVIEGGVKAELYPGHGKRTGYLQRAIQAEPARVISLIRAEGRIVVRGVPYAKQIDRRYRFFAEGFRKAKDKARARLIARMEREMAG